MDGQGGNPKLVSQNVRAVLKIFSIDAKLILEHVLRWDGGALTGMVKSSRHHPKLVSQNVSCFLF